MPTRLATKGDMTSRGVLSVVFKIPECTSHLGIGLVYLAASHSTNDAMARTPTRENLNS